MKKQYKKAIIEILSLSEQSVICSSGDTPITPGENELPIIGGKDIFMS